MHPLDDTDRDAQLAPLLDTGWALSDKGDALTKVFRFADFPAAMTFMTRCAFEAEALNHHPDWSNSYNKVTVRLSTHDIGGLSELDVKLAARMDAAA